MKLKARKIAARRAAGAEIRAAVARRLPQTVEDVSIGLGVRAELRAMPRRYRRAPLYNMSAEALREWIASRIAANRISRKAA